MRGGGQGDTQPYSVEPETYTLHRHPHSLQPTCIEIGKNTNTIAYNISLSCLQYPFRLTLEAKLLDSRIYNTFNFIKMIMKYIFLF